VVVAAAGNGRLLVELKNGHRLTIPSAGRCAGPRLQEGTRGRLELDPHPTSGWRFVAG
jgi:hypothetical protein